MPSEPAAAELAEVGRRFYARGLALCTSGNFSVVLSRAPLRVAITSSGRSKRTLDAADILECDEHGKVIARLKPSRSIISPSRSGRKPSPSAVTSWRADIAFARPPGASGGQASMEASPQTI